MKAHLIPLFILFICCSFTGIAQDVYKTPSGKKYHLSTCTMVETVSSKLVDGTDISKHKLSPCKICKPPRRYALRKTNSSSNHAVGTSVSVRCKGKTQKGTRCKHKTKMANGYCYQHTKQNSSSNTSKKKRAPHQALLVERRPSLASIVGERLRVVGLVISISDW